MSKIEEFLKNGISMHEQGIYGYALDRNQTLDFIDICRELNISILGGDVLENSEGELEHTYDSWYCNNDRQEGAIEFSHRSTMYAREYILNYIKNEKAYFILTLG